MANEINQLEDLNGVVHDLEDTAARSAIQTLDGQAVKSVNSKTPTAGAVTVEAEDVPYDPTGTGLEAQNVQSAVSELKNTITGHTSDTDIHVTSADKATWNAKQDALTVKQGIENGYLYNYYYE